MYLSLQELKSTVGMNYTWMRFGHSSIHQRYRLPSFYENWLGMIAVNRRPAGAADSPRHRRPGSAAHGRGRNRGRAGGPLLAHRHQPAGVALLRRPSQGAHRHSVVLDGRSGHWSAPNIYTPNIRLNTIDIAPSTLKSIMKYRLANVPSGPQEFSSSKRWGQGVLLVNSAG